MQTGGLNRYASEETSRVAHEQITCKDGNRRIPRGTAAQERLRKVMLKVLVWGPSNDGSPAGGHQIQTSLTADALNKNDKLHAILARQPDVDLAGFDIVHAFAPDLDQARRVRMHGTPLALSTIYCAKEYRNRGPGSRSLAQEALWRLRSSAGAVRAGMRGNIFAKAE